MRSLLIRELVAGVDAVERLLEEREAKLEFGAVSRSLVSWRMGKGLGGETPGPRAEKVERNERTTWALEPQGRGNKRKHPICGGEGR